MLRTQATLNTRIRRALIGALEFPRTSRKQKSAAPADAGVLALAMVRYLLHRFVRARFRSGK